MKLSIVALLLSATALPAFGQSGINVIVMDEGVDFTHPRISPYMNKNIGEDAEPNRLDDDRNGFVDDILGWNLVSNDGEQMPAWLMKAFTENLARVRQLFAMNDLAEQGDMRTILQLRANRQVRELMYAYLTKSHGTHVAGIVAAASRGSARISNLNIFTESRLPLGMSPRSAVPALEANNNEPDANFIDFLSRRSLIDRELANARREEADFERVTRQYLSAHGQGVVNMSFGTMLFTMKAGLDDAWKAALQERRMDPNTPRTAEQEANLNYFAETLYEIREQSLANVMRASPNVLFVVAAGNDTVDNDVNGVAPANLSAKLKNVITVAAVDKKGALTDFSDYGAKTVNVGALGHAVKSAAPAGLEVLMSGTSMAAPYVAGVAARLRAANPLLPASEIRSILERTGRRSPTLVGKTTTGMVIDATQALLAAQRRPGGRTVPPARTALPNGRGIQIEGSSPEFTIMLDTFARPGTTAETNEIVREGAQRRGRRSIR